MGIKTIIRKLFVSDNYFTIAIKHKSNNILQSRCFYAQNTVPANREKWCADPFLAQDGAQTFLFYEKVRDDLGSIAVSEVLDDCTLSEPTILFSDDSHYSYPYIFRMDGDWYMIPETSSLNEVSLYMANPFPFRWEKKAVLLHEPAVDTTVFQWKDTWYLLTFLTDPRTERVTPYAYRMEGIELSPMVWENYDPLCVRGAGRPFLYKDCLYRPVQVSTDQHYGNSVAFVRIQIDGNTYKESLEYDLLPNVVKAEGQFFDGLHTYNSSERFEVIDIRCGKINWRKPFLRIQNIFETG